MSFITAPRQPRSISDWLSLAALVICWGSSFAITKVALESMTPIWSVSLRLFFAILFYLPFFYLSGERLPRNRLFWQWMTMIAVLGTSLPFFLIAWGTQFIDTGVAGILIGAVPLFTIAFAHFLIPGERANFIKVLGFFTGFAGLVVLIGDGATLEFTGEHLVFLGEIAIVGACLCYSFQGICAKLMPPASVMQKTMAGMLIAMVPSFVFSLWSGTDGVTSVTWEGILASIALGILSTALAGTIMFRLIASAGPSFTSLNAYLIPVYTLALGVVVMDETVGPNTLLGLILVLGGIAISEIWNNRRRKIAVNNDAGS